MYQELNDLIELSGAENEEQFINYFNGMTQEEILKEADYMWPSEDNENFADRVHNVINWYDKWGVE